METDKHKKRRDKSRSQKPKKEPPQTEPPKNDSKEVEEDLLMFPEKPPWISTTPQARVARLTEGIQESASLPLPPQPNLPPPPATGSNGNPEQESLTEDEAKILQHLEELQKMGVTLTDDLKDQKDRLAAKKNKTPKAKHLTHGHLYKLDRVKGQINAIAGKIGSMDQDWNRFMTGTSNKVAKHAALYQACRQEMVANYDKKVAEFEQLKQEMRAASTATLDQEQPITEVPLMPNVAQQMQDLNQSMQESTQAPIMEVSDEEEELVTEVNMRGDGKPARKSNFRPSPSPARVATSHLKTKGDNK